MFLGRDGRNPWDGGPLPPCTILFSDVVEWDCVNVSVTLTPSTLSGVRRILPGIRRPGPAVIPHWGKDIGRETLPSSKKWTTVQTTVTTNGDPGLTSILV